MTLLGLIAALVVFPGVGLYCVREYGPDMERPWIAFFAPYVVVGVVVALAELAVQANGVRL